MEKGSLRVDANVSLRRPGEDELRTKTELKNMNSFSYLERGIARELRRQAELYEAGEEVIDADAALRPAPRTSSPCCAPRSWRTTTATSPSPTSCRSSRPPSSSTACARALPELPAARVRRFESDYALPLAQALDLGVGSGLAELLRGGRGRLWRCARGGQLGAQRVLGAPQRGAR